MKSKVTLFLLLTCNHLLLFPALLSANTGIMFIDEIYGFQETENIIYGTGSTGNPGSGSIDLCLDIYEPTGANLPVRRPALVMVHGGGFTGGTKEHESLGETCENFAKRGYVVVSIDYRLAGDDPTFEPGPTLGLDAIARAVNAASQDTAKAIRWLRQNAATYQVEPTRIAIGGSSAGAITSLFTASQEADVIGSDAEVAVVIDLWGGMSGAEFLYDSGDPPVFIAHGTLDDTVLVTQSENLIAHLDTINVPYEYYPLVGAGHGAWNRYFNDTVSGKTVFQHSVDFAFEHLNLIDLHPAGKVKPVITHDASTNQHTLSFQSYCDFQYIIYSSNDSNNWTPENADNPTPGNDNLLTYVYPTIDDKKFYRVEVIPSFLADISTFNASDDAYAKQSDPTANFGTGGRTQLRKDGASDFARVGFIKATVTDTTNISSAKLYLYSVDESDTLNVHAVADNSWDETTLTWNNKPPAGALINSSAAIPGGWFSVDVTSYVTSDGTYSFFLDEQGNSAGELRAKEGGNAPYLEIIHE